MTPCVPPMPPGSSGLGILALALAATTISGPAAEPPRVGISEIHYHPVERPMFTPDGAPVLDLTRDVHEFVELFNPGTGAVSLAGWRLAGGIRFRFPAVTLAPGGFAVIARQPRALEAVPAHALAGGSALGSYQGQLANDGDTLELRDASGRLVEAVTYSAEAPWPLAANAPGTDPSPDAANPPADQYRGRSLERVSFHHPPGDPANWVVSPATGPTPGRTNAASRAVPSPVVTRWQTTQARDGAAWIRAGNPVRLEVAMSGTHGLESPVVEYFSDDPERADETPSMVPLLPAGPPAEHRFVALLPGFPDRTIVRFRVQSGRGAGRRTVSPRPGDPPGWHAWFVTPVRPAERPAIDLFISRQSLHRLATNIAAHPRRVTLPDPPGEPRASWNATEPAVLVENGVVRDIQVRHHASRVHRAPGRGSYRVEFAPWDRPDGRAGVFIGDKPPFYIAAHGLFELSGLPTSRLRPVDLYVNHDPALARMELDMMDNALLTRFHAGQHRLNPDTPREPNGELYKSVGVLAGEKDGPYGPGDASQLPAIAPWWTPLQRYRWTYRLENHKWRGHLPLVTMIEGLWDARGDTPARPAPDLSAVRVWLEQNFDLDATLTYLALRAWAGSFDDTTQNYFLWRRAGGRWALLPWDFDFEFADHAVDCPIFLGEVGVTCDNRHYPGYRPNYLYDAVYKAFRAEFKERLFRLNNTLLHPDSLTALGYGDFLAPGDRITLRRYAELRQPQVNRQLNLGRYEHPLTPVALAPAHRSVTGEDTKLEASPYRHTLATPPAHRSTTWSIRAASNPPTQPVFRVNSTNHLTALPVPADRLTRGVTYLWKCTYTDARGHSSLDSAETAFVAGP